MRVAVLKCILFIVLPVFILHQLCATTVISSPSSAIQDEVIANATMAAMGGTSLGALGHADLSAIHPAGVTTLSSGGITLNHFQWMGDIEYNALSAGLHMGKYGVFGIFYRRANEGKIYVPYVPIPRGRWGEPVTVNASLHDASIMYGRKVLPAFAVGAQLQYFWIAPKSWYRYSRYSNKTLDNMALSVGTLFNPDWNDFTAAMSYRYIPFTSDYSHSTGKITHRLQASAGIDLVQLIGLDQYWPHTSLYAAGDWIHHQEYNNDRRLGIEYGYRDIVFLRAGYYFENGSSTRANWSRGVGLHIPIFGMHLHLDYAFRDLVVTDPIHWYSEIGRAHV